MTIKNKPQKNQIKLCKCKYSNKNSPSIEAWIRILIQNINLRGKEVLQEVLALWGLLVEYVAPLWTNIGEDAF